MTKRPVLSKYDASVKACLECGVYSYNAVKQCYGCGHMFYTERKKRNADTLTPKHQPAPWRAEDLG